MTTTIAKDFKEYMSNMPTDISEKDIIVYANNFFKEKKEERKKLKAEEAEKKKNEKTKKVVKKAIVKVDEEGNVIPKKLTMYQQYIKDNQQRIKEKYPDLNNTDRFSKLAEEWNEYKQSIVVEKKEEVVEKKEEVVSKKKIIKKKLKK